MISYVKGPLVEVSGDRIVIETGNVGLEIRVPLSLLDELPKTGEQIKVYTYFQVREDAMSLYGFLHRQDREMFQQLLGVNGVGPKGALGILSALRPTICAWRLFPEMQKRFPERLGLEQRLPRE